MAVELVASATATEDERLAQAEAVVRAYCGWHIAPSRTEVLTLDGPGGFLLTLPSLHVTAITEVTEKGTDLLPAVVLAADYSWSDAGIIANLCRHWRSSYSGITVSLTHGWPVPPADVASVVAGVALRAVANPGSLVSEQVGPFRNTYSQTSAGASSIGALSLFDSERQVLAPYKLPARP